jgi:hypothetical protein
MNYSDWVIAFLVELDDRREAWLLAVDLQRESTYGKSGRLRLRAQLESTQQLFVRHNRSYLYYGTHSAVGAQEHTQWEVNCADLNTAKLNSENMVVLDKFAGMEIGQTVCFEVYQGHLYAVSNEQTYQVEELQWTSYYSWIYLDPKLRMSRTHRIWRRQHREGPINNPWSDLSLKEDEARGQPMILECRKEWRDGGSESCRTYYIQPLPAPADVDKQQPTSDYYTAAIPDEPLAKMLDENSKPNYERPRKRLRRHYHSEYDGGIEPKPRRDFDLTKTKFRTYILLASSYLDLVNDPLPGGRGGDLVPRARLRLRVASRKRKCPIDEKGIEGDRGFLFKHELEADGRLVEDSEERFTCRGVHLWPPDEAPQELNDLLCPTKRTGQVQAIADERSIVYSFNKDDLKAGDQAIIFINFDPTLRLPGLSRMDLDNPTGKPVKTEAAIGIERPGVRPERAAMLTTVAGKRLNQNLPSVREECAMYLDIAHGFWFR